MGRRDRDHAQGRVAGVLSVLVVLALLAVAAAFTFTDVGARWFGLERPDPVENPAAVPPPAGLVLPTPAAAEPVAAAATDGRLDGARVRAAIARPLANRDLGKHVVAVVAPLDGGPAAYVTPTTLATPASTMKILTGVAALATVGPDTTFRTTVVGQGNRITLVGGGDPLLGSEPVEPEDLDEAYPVRADVTTLARRTAQALTEQGTRRVSVGYDDTLFSGDGVSPAWEPDYIPDGVVAPISALWVDGGSDPDGIGKVADPSRRAADVFTAALRRAGITVTGTPRPQRAPASATELAAVQSAPVEQLVQRLLEVSDNEAAEVMAHHVGLATSGKGTFAAGAAGVRSTLTDLGVPLPGAVIHDGSGLSRDDRLDVRTLLGALRVAASPEHPELRPVITGLPVAAFSGSLSDRFVEAAPMSRGMVRAKTGTLNGIHGLAGVAEDRDGTLMAFVMIADGVRQDDDLAALAARDALDAAAGELGDCRCG